MGWMVWSLTSVGARNYLPHTHLDWPWGLPVVLTMGTGCSFLGVVLITAVSFILLSAWNYSASSGQIFMKFNSVLKIS